MTRWKQASAFLLALAFLLPFTCTESSAGAPRPRSDALSVAITSPANGTTVRGDINVTGTASGPANASLAVQISIDDGPWHNVQGNLSWGWLWSTVIPGDGARRIRAKVTEGANESQTEISVTVDNAPAAARISGRSPDGPTALLRPGESVLFSVQIEGGIPGQSPVMWYLDDTLSSTGATSFNFSAVPGIAGNHSLEARLVDGGRTIDTVRWELTILPPDRPPVISGHYPDALDFALVRGDRLEFSVDASDPEGSALGYTWIADNETLGPANSTIELLFSEPGDHVVQVLVSDGRANRSVRWNVTVLDSYEPGILDLMPCVVYIALGLLLAVWYGRRARGAGARGTDEGT